MSFGCLAEGVHFHDADGGTVAITRDRAVGLEARREVRNNGMGAVTVHDNLLAIRPKPIPPTRINIVGRIPRNNEAGGC